MLSRFDSSLLVTRLTARSRLRCARCACVSADRRAEDRTAPGQRRPEGALSRQIGTERDLPHDAQAKWTWRTCRRGTSRRRMERCSSTARAGPFVRSALAVDDQASLNRSAWPRAGDARGLRGGRGLLGALRTGRRRGLLPATATWRTRSRRSMSTRRPRVGGRHGTRCSAASPTSITGSLGQTAGVVSSGVRRTCRRGAEQPCSVIEGAIRGTWATT